MLGITIGSHQSSPDIIYKDLAFFRTSKQQKTDPQAPFKMQVGIFFISRTNPVQVISPKQSQ